MSHTEMFCCPPPKHLHLPNMDGLVDDLDDDLDDAPAAPATTRPTRVCSAEEGEKLIATFVFAENIDYNLGAFLYMHFDTHVRPLLQDKSDEACKDIKRLLRQILKAVYKGELPTTYKKSEWEKSGRWYAVKSRSMQSLVKVLREWMCHLYVDLDIKNCHPTILQRLCDVQGFRCPRLADYVANRPQHLANLVKASGCTAKHAKKVYLAVQNGGDEYYEELSARTTHLEEFRDELVTIRSKFQRLYPARYRETKARREKAGKSDKTHSASLVSALCNQLENKILVAAWCYVNCPKTAILCFDGIMLMRRSGASPDDPNGGYDVGGITRHVRDELGVAVEFVAKPMQKCVHDIPRKELCGALQLCFRPKAYQKMRLVQLVKACCQEEIEKNFTAEQRRYIGDDAQRLIAAVKGVYDVAVRELLEYMGQYLYVIQGGTMTYCRDDYDAHGCRESITIYRCKQEVLNNWEDFKIFNKAVSKTVLTVGQLWLKSTTKRLYERQVFRSGTHIPYNLAGNNTMNTWAGWRHAVREGFVVDMERIRPLLEHLYTVICNSNKMYFYILKLWKLILLGKKTGVILCVSGAQGSGKSLMFEYFGEMIIGKNYYAYFSSYDDLTSRFTSMRANRVFIVADELGMWSGDHKGANFMKSVSTQETVKCERKGVDAVNVTDRSNYVLVSNHKNIVKVEGKGDRRHCMLEVSNARKGDVAYFNELCRAMGKDSFSGSLTEEEKLDASCTAEHFTHYLMQQDIEGFVPSQFPRTRLRKEQELAFTPALVSFVRWFVHEYLRLNTLNLRKRKHGVVVLIPPLFAAYQSVTDEVGMKAKFSTSKSLIPRLKRDYVLFRDNMHRNGRGSYFACNNMAALIALAEELDAKYSFETDFYDDVTLDGSIE